LKEKKRNDDEKSAGNTTKYCEGIQEIYKCTKNRTKEYRPRNLNAFDLNEVWLSETKKVNDRRNIFKENQVIRVN